MDNKKPSSENVSMIGSFSRRSTSPSLSEHWLSGLPEWVREKRSLRHREGGKIGVYAPGGQINASNIIKMAKYVQCRGCFLQRKRICRVFSYNLIRLEVK